MTTINRASTEIQHKCVEYIYHDHASFQCCGKTARFNETAKWYCKMHAPSERAAKRAAKDAAWLARKQADAAKSRRNEQLAIAEIRVLAASKAWWQAQWGMGFRGQTGQELMDAVDALITLEAQE